jgi:histidine triad (HIT) family protein
MSDCVFCRIAAGELPAAKVLETDAVLAFMDINPLSPGHVLVVPKRHYERLTDMPANAMAAVAKVLPAVARAAVAATKAEGFNVYQTNGACAGQQVAHVHFHIIPRRLGDGLGFRWNPRKYAEGEMERYRNLIARELAARRDEDERQ